MRALGSARASIIREARGRCCFVNPISQVVLSHFPGYHLVAVATKKAAAIGGLPSPTGVFNSARLP